MTGSKLFVAVTLLPFAVSLLPLPASAQPYPYGGGYGGRPDQFQRDDGYDRRPRPDQFRREDRGRDAREDQRSQQMMQQQVRDAQTRHNQGVVALQQQFNQRQISRPQLEAGYRQLEAQMNGDIQRAQQGQRR